MHWAKWVRKHVVKNRQAWRKVQWNYRSGKLKRPWPERWSK